MKKIALQLFLNKFTVRQQIEEIQSKPDTEWDKTKLDALHAEWDRTEHLIELFFESVGL